MKFAGTEINRIYYAGMLVVGLVLLCSVLLSGCTGSNAPVRLVVSSNDDPMFIQEQAETSISDNVLMEDVDLSESDHEHRLQKVRINVVGDIMVHRTQLIKADRVTHFDFNPAFEHVAELIGNADYSFGNLETTMAGEYGQRKIGVENFYKGYSGFPCFNTPDSMAQALKDSGFDFLSTANNHTADSKESGIRRTLDVLDSVGLKYTGSYRSEEAAGELTVVEVEGITFGVVNFTYGLNGFVLNADEDYMVNHLDMYDENRLQTMYSKVKDAEDQVDFVIVMLHYGNEYVIEPDRYYQRPIVDGLFESGADIIFGGHPHVLQPIETRRITRSDGKVENGVVIYSLGNFLSSQRSLNSRGDDTDIGAIFEVTLYKPEHHRPYIGEIAFTPTMTQWASDSVRVLAPYDLPDNLELDAYSRSRVERSMGFISDHMQKYLESPMDFDGIYYRMTLDR